MSSTVSACSPDAKVTSPTSARTSLYKSSRLTSCVAETTGPTPELGCGTEAMAGDRHQMRPSSLARHAVTARSTVLPVGDKTGSTAAAGGGAGGGAAAAGGGAAAAGGCAAAAGGGGDDGGGGTAVEDATTTSTDDPDFDDILEMVGNSGRFQRRLLLLLVYPAAFLLAWMVLNILFMLSVPDHWCHVPGRADLNLSVEQWKNLTIPSTVGESGAEYSKCLMYNVSLVDNWLQYSYADNSSRHVTECRHGWDYDRSSWRSTAVTQFDWVCERASYPTTVLTMNSVGSVFGTLVHGTLADIIGRRPVFFGNIGLFIVSGVVNIYASTFTVFVASRAIAQSTFPALYNTFFTLAVELVGPSLRGHVNAICFVVWTVSMCSLPLVAWLTADWQTFGLITMLPAVGFFAVMRYIPESPRWLIGVRRKKEAKLTLEKIAKVNRREVPKSLESMLDHMAAKIEKEKKYGLISLFSNRLSAIRTVLLTFCFIGNIVVYYGLQMNSSNMAGNEFLNFFLLSAVEAPANVVGWLGSEHLGRRWMEVAFFVITGLACLSIMPILYYPDMLWLVTTLAIVAKFAITVSFFVVFLQSAEIYPTVLRGSGQALGSTIAYAVAIGSPAIIYLSNTNIILPYMILGLIALVCAVMASFLPETLGTDMPQCVEDTRHFLADQRYFSWITRRSLARHSQLQAGRRRSTVVTVDSGATGGATGHVTALADSRGWRDDGAKSGRDCMSLQRVVARPTGPTVIARPVDVGTKIVINNCSDDGGGGGGGGGGE